MRYVYRRLYSIHLRSTFKCIKLSSSYIQQNDISPFQDDLACITEETTTEDPFAVEDDFDFGFSFDDEYGYVNEFTIHSNHVKLILDVGIEYP